MDTRAIKRTAALLRDGARCELTAADELDAAADEIERLRIRLMTAERGEEEAARAEKLYREAEALITGAAPNEQK